MPVTVVTRGNDEAVKSLREAWANRVIHVMDDQFPDLRVLVFLAETDEPTLKSGDNNRGKFSPIDKNYINRTPWTRAVGELLRTIRPGRPEADYHYDAVIYLHDGTCQAEESLTMTLAHELQHLIQYGFSRSVWAWNTVPTNLSPGTKKELGLVWCDIPTEYEARLVARRVSEAILGRDRTARYIEKKINEHVTDCDAADWERIRGMDTSKSYDCTVKTRELFERLAPVHDELKMALDRAKGLPDFKDLNVDDMIRPLRA